MRDNKMFALDTNILIELSDHNEKVIAFLRLLISRFPGQLYIPSPVYSEFLYGFMNKSEEKKRKAKEFLSVYGILNTSKNSSEILATIKHELEKEGTPIPIFDTLIASIVLDNGGTLVTMDRHFENVNGLNVKLIDKE